MSVKPDIERALARSEARFRQVVESAPNAMVMIRDNGLIEMVNTQAELVFGYSRDEMLGKPVEILIPERFRKHHPAMRHSFFGEPRSRPMGAGRDLLGLKKDGSEFQIEIGLNPIETEEGIMVLSAIVDISDRKEKAERIEAALKEKDVLLGEIHHRVKNNLHVINSLLNLQSSRIQDQTARAVLKASRDRIKSMSLVHQYQSKDSARVDFDSFLTALVSSLLSSHGVDPARIAVSIDAADVSVPLSAAIPCGLIVNELVTNALKHGFPDGRKGHITVELVGGPDQRVVITVSDDGVGIPEEQDLTNSTTLGWQLIMLLSEQIGAEMTIHRADPTSLRLTFAVQT